MFKYTDIGIDFGEYSMKVSAYISKENKYSNKEYLMSSTLTNPESYFKEAREYLESFKKENKIKFSSIRLSLPSDIKSYTGIGYTEFPTDKKSVIQKAIRYEIQEQMDITFLNDYEYIWEDIDTYKDEEGKDINVKLYNVLSKEFTSELKKFINIKTKIKDVFLHPMHLKEKIDKNSIVLDLGYRNARVYIYEFGVLQSTEIINFGEKNINDVIKRTTNYTHEDDILAIKNKCYIINESEDEEYDENNDEDYEDEEYYYDNDNDKEDVDDDIYGETYDLINFGKESLELNDDSDIDMDTKTEDEELIYDCSLAITEEISDLIQKVKQAIRSYELVNEMTFQEFYILGGLSKLKNLEQLLSNEFSLEVNQLSEHRSFKKLQISKEENEFILSNILADKDKDTKIKPLNFNKFTKNTVDIIPILLGVLCMTLIINLAALKINKDYNLQIEELTSELNTVSSEANRAKAITENIKREIREVEALASSSGKIDIQKKWLSSIFKVLKEITPHELVIYKIDSKPNILTFKGYSKNYSDIGFLGLALSDYGKVTVKEINKSDETKFIEKEKEDDLEMQEEFIITLEYQGLLEKEGNLLADEGK